LPDVYGQHVGWHEGFIEAAAKKWFTLAWKNKVAGAFTNSSSFSGDKLNTLVGLVINAMQHGMIFVGLGMMPSSNKPEDMNQIAGPGPDAHNRVGSFIGPMAASFQVNPPDAPCKAILRRRRCMAVVSQKSHFNSSEGETPDFHPTNQTGESARL